MVSETGSMGPTDAMNTVLVLVVCAVDNILCSLATAALDQWRCVRTGIWVVRRNHHRLLPRPSPILLYRGRSLGKDAFHVSIVEKSQRSSVREFGPYRRRKLVNFAITTFQSTSNEQGGLKYLLQQIQGCMPRSLIACDLFLQDRVLLLQFKEGSRLLRPLIIVYRL